MSLSEKLSYAKGHVLSTQSALEGIIRNRLPEHYNEFCEKRAIANYEDYHQKATKLMPDFFNLDKYDYVFEINYNDNVCYYEVYKSKTQIGSYGFAYLWKCSVKNSGSDVLDRPKLMIVHKLGYMPRKINRENLFEYITDTVRYNPSSIIDKVVLENKHFPEFEAILNSPEKDIVVLTEYESDSDDDY